MFTGNDKSNGHSGLCECNECIGIENDMEHIEETQVVTERMRAVNHAIGLVKSGACPIKYINKNIRQEVEYLSRF